MNTHAALTTLIRPALADLHQLGGPVPSLQAERFLLAVALQESNLVHRDQVIASGKPGHARGFWQFELGGGARGVLSHRVSRNLALRLCWRYGVEPTPGAVWAALTLERYDRLACGFARLLLWTDPHPIPDSMMSAWTAYADRLWRPGKPHFRTWAANWGAATRAVGLSA